MKKRLGVMLIGCMLGLPLAGHAAQTCNSEAEIPSSTPDSRFTDHGNGTVTDTLTGLMWAHCVAGLSGAGCTTGTASTHTWQGALDLADADAHAGYTDWRLPNIQELSSIVEQRCLSPAINLAVFPNTPASVVWSASPSAFNSNSAWFVNFVIGDSGDSGRGGSFFGVRLVRSGQ